MIALFVIGVVIILVVLILSVVTTSKAYSYKHTVDPLDNNPNLPKEKEEEEK